MLRYFRVTNEDGADGGALELDWVCYYDSRYCKLTDTTVEVIEELCHRSLCLIEVKLEDVEEITKEEYDKVIDSHC